MWGIHVETLFFIERPLTILADVHVCGCVVRISGHRGNGNPVDLRGKGLSREE